MARARAVQALTAALVTVLLTSSCSGTSAPTGAQPRRPDAVVVASFDFTESVLLAEIYAAALERAGVPVRRELRLGTLEMVDPAVHQALVDVVPEYLGSALRALVTDAPGNPRDVTTVRRDLAGALRPWAVKVLTPSSAQNQNGIAVTRATAGRLHLRTLTDLARVSAGLTLTGPAECPQRPLCLQGLERVYRLRFKGFLPYAGEQQRLDALVQAVADVGVVFTTDGRLASSDLVLLADDRGLQPAENITPIVSERAVQQFGSRVVEVLDAVSGALDSDALRFLSWRVEVAGHPVADEARAWLLRHPDVTADPVRG